MKGHSLVTVCP